MSGNPFHEEWRDCLRAHFLYVIQSGDRVTEPSLGLVMLEAGFTEAELAELRVRATLRVEDAPPGFVPDLDALRVYPAAAPQPEPESAELLMEPEAFVETIEPAADPADPEPVTVEHPAVEPPPDDADLPQQLSLF